MTDRGRYSQTGARAEGVCLCIKVNVSLFVCTRKRLLEAWVCTGTSVMCTRERENTCNESWKVNEGIGNHVGWIKHFCLKKKKKRSWRPVENLGVNKEELLVTLAPPGLPLPVTCGESEAIYTEIIASQISSHSNRTKLLFFFFFKPKV